MKAIHWVWAAVLAAGVSLPAAAQGPEKVLRYAFPIAETGFDPAQVHDLYSRVITANIFETLYDYDYLARPAKVKPVLAEALPQVSADFRTWTIRLKRGVYFADDPAFGGKKREVTAQDVVYSFKRIYDPKTRSPHISALEEEKIIGLDELREKAEKTGKFDYVNDIEGMKALDRYTVQFKLAVTRPRFVQTIADPGILGVVAREVIDKYGDEIMAHPVGTGPFKLAEWKRSSRITLVKNPNFRDEFFDDQPRAGDKSAEAVAARLKGKKLPMLDKVVVSIINEPQPRWLSFLNAEQDFMERLPATFVNQAIPNNKLAPNLQKKGIQMERVQLSDITMWYFNMEDPVVGGYTPEKVALRRALGLAYNTEMEVRLPRRGQAIIAQDILGPNTTSWDPNFRSEMGKYDRARAIALLDMFGYTDKNGDGWRDMPDGKPLVLEMNTQGTADQRELDEILKKHMDAVGVKMEFKIGIWPEQLKAARAGKLQMWQLGFSAAEPDSGVGLQIGASAQAGQQNLARFSNKQYDEIFAKQGVMPDGPERDAQIRDAVRIIVAYMPYKIRVSRIGTDLWQPWVMGYKRHPFSNSFWRYIDIDTTKLPAH
ncbi:ABC transporter substrate-binding protein [Ramlibacter sp. PS4R-6]|uniref:ABC transporter substrate-binding protein n=1 Tax=Ramlibacter sp. PS4R-6 TaxID=3133438 RepID=UPI0030A3BED7